MNLIMHSSLASIRLGPHILLSTLFSKSPIYVLPLVWQTRFHTCRKQEVKLWFPTCKGWQCNSYNKANERDVNFKSEVTKGRLWYSVLY